MKAFGQIIENGLSDQNDPFVLMNKLIKELKEKKKMITNYENTIYDAIGEKRAAKEKANLLSDNLQRAEIQIFEMEEIIGQR